ncbi:hypothetical protein CAM18_04225 [Salmonella enterica]|nr:hypothetical protein [Salmonella enterica]EBK6349933.1 hypothetical protein [Salmonella enterica]ECS8314248.1 hypothetical protein [Salmonella enterica subsp. enterica serovar Panama]
MQKELNNGDSLITSLRKKACWRWYFCARTNNGTICILYKEQDKGRNTTIGLMQSVHPWFKSLRHWTASCQDIAYEPDTTNTANGKYLVSMTGKKTANQWRKQRKNIQQRNINTSA